MSKWELLNLAFDVNLFYYINSNTVSSFYHSQFSPAAIQEIQDVCSCNEHNQLPNLLPPCFVF